VQSQQARECSRDAHGQHLLTRGRRTPASLRSNPCASPNPPTTPRTQRRKPAHTLKPSPPTKPDFTYDHPRSLIFSENLVHEHSWPGAGHSHGAPDGPSLIIPFGSPLSDPRACGWDVQVIVSGLRRHLRTPRASRSSLRSLPSITCSPGRRRPPMQRGFLTSVVVGSLSVLWRRMQKATGERTHDLLDRLVDCLVARVDH